MSNYDEETLKIKKEFIETLRADLKTDLLDKNIDKNKIRKCLYLFIYGKVFNTIKIGKKIRVGELIWSMFWRTVDFTLSFGNVMLDCIFELRDFEIMQGTNINGQIDA
ncbi:hypothetical protein ES703_09896 [subsurface metagenome]